MSEDAVDRRDLHSFPTRRSSDLPTDRDGQVLGAVAIVRDVTTRWEQEQALRRRLVTLETAERRDRKSTRLNSSHITISYAVCCLKKKKCSTTGRKKKRVPRRTRP